MSFEEYVGRRLGSLLALAGVLCGDRYLSEDVVQEVLLRASRRWTKIVSGGDPDPYVRRMVVNDYLSWRRKWWRLVPVAEVRDERVEADPAERHAERASLSTRLDGLPRRQRAVLVLRYYEDLDDHTIARLLGCSEGTVRSHASRALNTLRVRLEFPEPHALRKDG
jgi:RNA polymerase sigma-70 factor (sigma-E family)